MANDYWKERALKREQQAYLRGERLRTQLEGVYHQNAVELMNKIYAFYGKYCNKFNMSLEVAKKYLGNEEYSQFRFDVETYMKKFAQSKKLDEKIAWLRELETLSARSSITRLERLLADCLMQLQDLNEYVYKALTDELKELYTESYYNSLFDLNKSNMGVATRVNPKHIEDLVNANWCGLNYSERIWKNRDQLALKVKDLIIRNFVQGSSSAKLARELAREYDTSFHRASTLIRTELSYAHNKANLDSITDSKIKQIKFLATLDFRTSSVCRNMDGKIIDVDKAVQGTNTPPLHPNCRSTTVAYFEGLPIRKRFARDKNGKPIQVDADMTYEDWKKIYIDEEMTYKEWRKAKPKPIVKSSTNMYNQSEDKKVEKIRQYANNIDMKTATPQQIIKLGEMVNEQHNITEIIGNKEKLVEVFSNYREMGGELTKEMGAKGNNRNNFKMLQDAFKCYPKDWVRYLEQNNKKIFTKKVDRGYFFNSAVITKRNKLYYATSLFDDVHQYVTIHMDGIRKTTPFHEIGHMVEHFNPNALRINREFVSYRTKGEKLTRLRDIFPLINYAPSEVVYKDNFISPYIGKKYTNASEVLSMGLESIFEPGKNGKLHRIDSVTGEEIYKKITDDMEYLHLIIGMIVKG